MQPTLVRGLAARPAAAPTHHLSSEPLPVRSLSILNATRQAPGGPGGRPRRAADGTGAVSSSAGRAKAAAPPSTTSPADAKPPKVRLPKKTASPLEETVGGEGDAGLDELDSLLADADAVRQLRSSLLASLSAQHEEAVREEGSTSPSQHQQHQDPVAATVAVAAMAKADDASSKAKPMAAGSAVGRSAAQADAPTATSSSSSTTSGVAGEIPTVILKKDKARLFVSGNPMVYGGAVDCVIGRPPPGIGDTVIVVDSSRRTVGWGVFNPHSMFRVRLLQLQPEMDADPRVAAGRLDVPVLLAVRVRQAAELRRALGLPSPETNVYRLVNSEGDRLSGLVADVLGDTVVVQAVAGWVQRYRTDVEAAIRAATGLTRIVWRPLWKILEEEGLEPPLEAAAADVDDAEEAPARPAEGGTVEVREAGLRLLASPQGQKTGFYADQRDSRAFLAGLVRAQAAAGSAPTMLDLCCYSGGFALAAAAAGAARVVGVDSSEPAVTLATANAQLNGLSASASFARADVSEYMKVAVAQGQQYDIVVLDPPKLAPDRNLLARARIKYLRLNSLAMKLVRPGGLLMTCSCSGAMTQSDEFTSMVVDAARQAGRQPTVLREAGAAPDHALNPAYPEGEYLTNITLRLL